MPAPDADAPDNGRSTWAHIMGVSVSDTTAEIKMATANVMANSWNKRPTTSPMNNNGINTATNEKVSEMMVKPICRAPSRAACIGCMGLLGSCKYLAMFSIITIASSTTNPVATVRAIKVRLLIEKPAKYITPNVPTKDSGTTTAGISVAEALRRNKKITITTKAIDNNSSNCTSRTDARMVTVRSVSTCSVTPGGMASRNAGNCCWMRSTVSITFAPGCRCMLTMMAGVLSAQAASRLFCGASTTSATSPKRKGLPLTNANTNCAYSLGERNWSFASKVDARAAPSKLPLAMFTFDRLIALRTSSSDKPAAAKACGLTCTRTAGR